MRKINLLVVAGLLAAGSQTAVAQGHGQSIEHKGRVEHGRHLDKANLTEAQRQQLRAVHDRYEVQFEALKTQIKVDRKAMQTARKNRNTEALLVAKAALERDEAQLRSLRQARRNEILAIVPASERARMEEHMNKKDKMENRRADHKRAGHDRRDWGHERGKGEGKNKGKKDHSNKPNN